MGVSLRVTTKIDNIVLVVQLLAEDKESKEELVEVSCKQLVDCIVGNMLGSDLSIISKYTYIHVHYSLKIMFLVEECFA